ncbi:MAG: hypothetical protein BROFUL_02463 [Candidatus Brocadia fulgida]|jgi:hypothetical protein|uniref:Uncharacterized protein n=1 Tax=Candidatus Brocadia fulgida TaxID=380242 RepID=A0A0M2USI8_9BACT|nr:MAG: hypothetical protein BROFUL_02463 [Candidatus Brocadia fulgida]MBV6517637.1 hypothetical protein [Candidatus Brocadia fulgida]
MSERLLRGVYTEHIECAHNDTCSVPSKCRSLSLRGAFSEAISPLS